MEEPLANYSEVQPVGPRRSLELFADRVVVKARSWRGEGVFTVMLADLRSAANVLRGRRNAFVEGLPLIALSVALGGAAILARGWVQREDVRAILLMAAAGPLLFVSLVLLLLTFRKIEFVQFVSHQGKPLLDVVKAGPQRGNFDTFVQALVDQICKCSPYWNLRAQALLRERHEIVIAEPPLESPVWGVFMEQRILVATVFTVFSLADGTTSIYIEGGRSVIGGRGHESVRQAAAAFLAAANQLHRGMNPAQVLPQPAIGRVAFHARTDAGLLTCDASEDELRTGRNPFSPLFFAGHVVIAELRKACESKEAGVHEQAAGNDCTHGERRQEVPESEVSRRFVIFSAPLPRLIVPTFWLAPALFGPS